MFGVSDLACVFEGGFKLPEIHDTIKVFGIRGEIISGQFALQALNNLTNITVDVSGLNNQAIGKTLPPTAVSWNFVGSIPLTKNAPNQTEEVIPFLLPAFENHLRPPDYIRK